MFSTTPRISLRIPKMMI